MALSILSVQNGFTRAMWWISGAESSILKKYPTEYSKFAIIGSMIFVTFLVAFASGCSAAYYFSGRWLVSVGFGLFWGIIIFCIDRALVVTMKKNLHHPTWRDTMSLIFKTIFPRACLAILVAFLMSIPLELLMFEDLIQQELPAYKEAKLLRANQTGYHAENLKEVREREDLLREDGRDAKAHRDKVETALNATKKKLANVQSQIAAKRGQLNHPSTARYQGTLKQSNELRAQLSRLRDDDPARKGIQAKINAQRGIMNEEIKGWNSRLNQEIQTLEAESAKLEKESRGQADELKTANDRVDKTQERINDVTDKVTVLANVVDSTASEIGDKFDRSNKFIQYYSVLDFAVTAEHAETIKSADGETERTVMVRNNPEAYRLLWFVRLIFFIFEMLPTVVKATAKPGPYEYAVEAHEENVKAYLNSAAYHEEAYNQLHAQLEHEHQLAEDRHAAEKELHDRLLNRIRTAQEEVASAAIEKWRRSQLGAAPMEAPKAPKAPKEDDTQRVVTVARPPVASSAPNPKPSNDDFETINKDEWD